MEARLETKDVKGQIDKRNIYLLLGCYCNNPKLLLDEKFSTKIEDYPEMFHATVFGAMLNIVKKTNIEKITAIEIENEMSQFPAVLELWKRNDGYAYITSAIEDTKDKVANVEFYRDTVRKYSILRHGVEELKLDLSFLYDENNEQIMSKFNSLSANELLAQIVNKFNSFKDTWNDMFSRSKSFLIGDDIDEIIKGYQNKDDECGYPFQSSYLTSIFSGMRNSKYCIVSSTSGGGKSRTAMAEASNLACSKMYDWQKNIWISTGERLPVLYISTELTKKEIQECVIPHISGISPRELKNWALNDRQQKILQESVEEIKQAELYCEYLPDFTIDSITQTIEKYILNHNVQYVYFDYINDSPQLYRYYGEITRGKLRSDQILYMFSEGLKLIANEYNIWLRTSTQLNRSYKEGDNKDSSSIKGSNAIIEKADYGIIMLQPTTKDLDKLKPVIERCGGMIPNTAYHIYKNRDGEYKNVVVWTKLDLGTVREQDCFVTDNAYNLLDVEKVVVDFSKDEMTTEKVEDNNKNLNLLGGFGTR